MSLSRFASTTAFDLLLNSETVTREMVITAGLKPDQWFDGEENLVEEPGEFDDASELPGYDDDMPLQLPAPGTEWTAEDARAWRENLDWTQGQAAEQLGISRRAYVDYESGKTRIPFMAVLAMTALQAANRRSRKL